MPTRTRAENTPIAGIWQRKNGAQALHVRHRERDAGFETGGGINQARFRRGEWVAAATSEQSDRFAKHEVAGSAQLTACLNLLLQPKSALVVLVAYEIASDEGSRIYENHARSP